MARLLMTDDEHDTNPEQAVEASDERQLERALGSVKAAEREIERKERVRQPSYQAKAAPAVTVITLSECEAKNGYEIRFPGKPEDNWLKLIKEWRHPKFPEDRAIGRWNFRRYNDARAYEPLWWIKRSPEALKFAQACIKVAHGADLTVKQNIVAGAPQDVIIEG